MSRYVDLNGVSWDGKPILSKIQEVKTKQGYLQGITVGWLWGDSVPHIDLEKHDKQIRADVIDEYKEEVLSRFCECCDQYACNGAMIGSRQECTTICMLRNVCTDIANELKEQNK